MFEVWVQADPIYQIRSIDPRLDLILITHILYGSVYWLNMLKKRQVKAFGAPFLSYENSEVTLSPVKLLCYYERKAPYSKLTQK